MNSSWPAISALIAFTCLSCTGNSLDPTPDGLTDYERRLYAHLVHGPTANEGRMTFFIDSVAHPEGREQPSKAVATMKVHPDSLEFIDTLRIYYGSDLELWFTDLDARVAIGGTVRGHVTGHLLGEKRGGHVLVEFREFTLTDSLISGRFGAGIWATRINEWGRYITYDGHWLGGSFTSIQLTKQRPLRPNARIAIRDNLGDTLFHSPNASERLEFVYDEWDAQGRYRIRWRDTSANAFCELNMTFAGRLGIGRIKLQEYPEKCTVRVGRGVGANWKQRILSTQDSEGDNYLEVDEIDYNRRVLQARYHLDVVDEETQERYIVAGSLRDAYIRR